MAPVRVSSSPFLSVLANAKNRPPATDAAFQNALLSDTSALTVRVSSTKSSQIDQFRT